jgi:copper chaperone CopZ
VEGITRADVSLGAVEVEHDGRVTVDQLRVAIAVAGYEVRDATVDRRRLPLA